MISRSTLIHLRIPFSYFLTPIFFFSLSFINKLNWPRIILIFIILHLFLYPASNAFNSYYDRDKGSIGGIKKPPPVEKDLIIVSLIFDLIAVLLGFFVDWVMVLALFFYGIASKVYSYKNIRLKKRPIIGWLGTGFVQGGFTFLMVTYALTDNSWNTLFKPETLIPAGLCTVFLLASYPMTQIYQHKEDSERGDISLSILLGIKGTFIFTAVIFIFVTAGFILFYCYYYKFYFSILFFAIQIPVFIYFIIWMVRSFREEKKADYSSTMGLNLITSTAMNIFCILFIVLTHIHSTI